MCILHCLQRHIAVASLSSRYDVILHIHPRTHAGLVSGVLEGAQGLGFFLCLFGVLLTFLCSWRGIGFAVVLFLTRLAIVDGLINSIGSVIKLWKVLS